MRRLLQMTNDQGLKVVDVVSDSASFISGPLATFLSWLARLFPEPLLAVLTKPLWPRERLYRTRLTFLRNVFLIGKKV